MSVVLTEHPCPVCGTMVRMHGERVTCRECGYVLREPEPEEKHGGEIYGYE